MEKERQTSHPRKVIMAFLVTCTTIYLALSTGNAFPVHAHGTSSTHTDSSVSVRTFEIACAYQTNTVFEARVIELINIERAKVGLTRLRAQSKLTTAAQLHSSDMACNNYLSHTGSDGSTPAIRTTRQGYSGSFVGENIAAGYSTPEDVMNGWMNSSGHKANILNVNYTEVGVGYSYWAGSTYGAYWTTDFAASSNNTNFPPVKGDYNGDGKTEIAIFRASNSTWYIHGQGSFVHGQTGDIPVPADFNGDGKVDIAVFRPGNSTWYIYGQGSFVYGQPGDTPVPADYNGDGKAEIAVFRPSNSTWYIYGVGPFVYGTVGDIPVVADYNGDGKADIAVFRPSNSTWYIYGIGRFVYGTVGDIPVVADYNGDGKADIAVFRPTNSTWYIYGVGPFVYGTVGDIPVIGDYNGDGKADIAVFRPTNSTWYIYGVGPSIYGTAGDIPV